MSGTWKTDTGIAWIDVESTSLNPWKGAKLLEVACVITDADLNIVDEVGYEAVVAYDPEYMPGMRAHANAYVRNMHDQTGLWEETVKPTAKSLETIDLELTAYLFEHNPTGRKMPLGGNSIRLDFNFLERYLPSAYATLDYHMIDLSTVAGLAHRWFDIEAPKKASDHTAMTDIRESIKELAYYRSLVFRAAEELIPECQACYRPIADHKEGCPAA